MLADLDKTEASGRVSNDADHKTGLAAAEAEAQTPAAESASDAARPVDTPPQRAPRDWEQQLPHKLLKIVARRIALWIRIMALDRQRDGLLEQYSGEDRIGKERGRQRRELGTIPDLEQLHIDRQQLQGEIKSIQEVSSTPEAQSSDAGYLQLLEIGLTQSELLVALRRFDNIIPHAAAPATEDEPMMRLCERHRIDARALLGWTFYALILQRRIRDLQAARWEAQDPSPEAGTAIDEVDNSIAPQYGVDTGLVLEAAERELGSIETQLVALFWPTYEEVAWLLVNQALKPEDIPRARAWLRYGVVTTHPALVDQAVADRVLSDCREEVYRWNNGRDAWHVVYPDEYLEAVHRGLTTPGPDEALELSRDSRAVLKTERLWRRSLLAGVRLSRYRAEADRIKRLQAELEAERQRKQARLHAARASRDRAQVEALETDSRALRGRIGHLRRVHTALVEERIPEQERYFSGHDTHLQALDEVLPPQHRIRRECLLVRRCVRLCAWLKERPPQLMLTSELAQNNANHIRRRDVIATLKDIERRDRLIFCEDLVPGAHLDRQAAVRLCPTFLIVPTRGDLGVSVSPRQTGNNGHLAVPLASSRRQQLSRMLVDILADFRWDTSREQAGLDWITADALCSAYAALRWDYRNMPKKARDRAGIDRRLTHRQNWRAHYRKFIESADDGGRRLFYKCPKVYEIIMQYIGLPEGIERMHSNAAKRSRR